MRYARLYASLFVLALVVPVLALVAGTAAVVRTYRRQLTRAALFVLVLFLSSLVTLFVYVGVAL